MPAFPRRSQSTSLRRALFQVHLWLGVLAGVYVFAVCLSGAALVFRIDLQRALHPELFTAGERPHADPAAILDAVREAHPGWRVSGIDAPTTSRPTYLAYVVDDVTFRTVFVDPASARVLGELPDRSAVRLLQELHFDLFGGRTGRAINGFGGLILLALGLTGIVIWWPGTANWRRGFVVDVRRSWKRIVWDLHSATGIWAVAFVAMWAVTGVYFAFPSQFRAAVHAVSPLTLSTPPRSSAPAEARAPADWRDLLARAAQHVPNQHVARVVLPFDERAAFLVMFSPVAPYPAGSPRLTSVYLDPYTGERLAAPPRGTRSPGDIVMDWVAPLHVGNFAGIGVRLVWFVFGLAPPLLFVTGFTMWWTRVVRPRAA